MADAVVPAADTMTYGAVTTIFTLKTTTIFTVITTIFTLKTSTIFTVITTIFTAPSDDRRLLASDALDPTRRRLAVARVA